MKRNWKRFLCICIAVFCGVMSFGCVENIYYLSDIAPKSFGEWDGNYIYHGNMRAKTTGEEGKRLVSEISVGEESFHVKSPMDFTYRKDEIFMTFALPEDEMGEEIQNRAALVRYDIQEKKADTIYYGVGEIAPQGIYKIFDDFLLIKVEDESILKIGYDGSILDYDASRYKDYHYAGEYIVKYQDSVGRYCYADVSTEEFIPYYDNTKIGYQHYVEYIEREGVKGFLISIVPNGGNPQLSNYGNIGFSFFNLETGSTVEFAPPTSSKLTAKAYKVGDYLLLAKRTGYTYWIENRRVWEEETRKLDTHCVLYKINYQTASLEEVYDFTEKYPDVDFSSFKVKQNGEIYFDAEAIETGYAGYGCLRGKQGGYRFTHYILSPKTGRLTKGNAMSDNLTETERWLSAETSGEAKGCGQYLYKITIREFTVRRTGWKQKAFFLYRFDKDNGEVSVMQFWCEKLSEMYTGTQIQDDDGDYVWFQYSLEMWFGEKDSSIIPKNFIVRNY